MGKRKLQPALKMIVLSLMVLIAAPWSSHAESPGLPDPVFHPGGWVPVQQLGMAEAAKAQQWVAVPPLSVTSWSSVINPELDPEPGIAIRETGVGDTFFVSPPGAPDPYGHLPPLRVRTVGFGLLPVEATVHVS